MFDWLLTFDLGLSLIFVVNYSLVLLVWDVVVCVAARSYDCLVVSWLLFVIMFLLVG